MGRAPTWREMREAERANDAELRRRYPRDGRPSDAPDRRRALAAILSMARPAFYDDALCRGKTDLFYAPAGERQPYRWQRERDARALCAQCPVSVECAAKGRADREYGIWGGEDETDRAKVGVFPPAASHRDRNVRTSNGGT